MLTTGLARRAVAPVLLLAALAGGLAACGGGSSTASPTTSTTGPASSSLSAFRTCLTSHGVPASAAGSLFGRRRGTGSGSTTPSSTPSSSNPPPTIPAQYQAAFSACRSLLPSSPFGGAGGGINSARFAAYRNCLQVNGVTLPTPTTKPGQSPSSGGFGGANSAFGQLRNNPKFQAAQKACQSLLPTRSATSTTVASS